MAADAVVFAWWCGGVRGQVVVVGVGHTFVWWGSGGTARGRGKGQSAPHHRLFPPFRGHDVGKEPGRLGLDSGCTRLRSLSPQ